MSTQKCQFDQWYDGELNNINEFRRDHFKAFISADGDARAKLTQAFPEYFKGQTSL